MQYIRIFLPVEEIFPVLYCVVVIRLEVPASLYLQNL
jgi:hypothetical protein